MASFATNHYSLALKMDKLLPWAEETAKTLHGYVAGTNAAPIFCFQGLSGTGHGLALAAAYYRRYGEKFGLVYVRKDEEKCHQVDKCAFSLNNVNRGATILVFVDDFIDRGATRERVLKKAKANVRAKAKRTKLDADYFIQCQTRKVRKLRYSEIEGTV